MSAHYNHFNTLRKPVITEKSYTLTGEANQYTFKVAPTATKNQIKDAIQAIFEVDVQAVQVMNIQGKEKRRGAHLGRRTGYRKAIVRLKDGQSLQVSDEV
ncbi:MAG: 50S ribosomal protein L23 [Zetaproteobacteria bacterium]|nr:50S ribosomal protein L23 [Zetaproteobacteria bacterium]